jgi:hypothetical protein
MSIKYGKGIYLYVISIGIIDIAVQIFLIGRRPIMSLAEFTFFQNSHWNQVFLPMNFEGWTRFSPLAYGPIGKLLVEHNLVENLTLLFGIHLLLLTVLLCTLVVVGQKLSYPQNSLKSLLVLVGLSTNVIFNLGFISTFAIYFLQFATILLVYVLRTLNNRSSVRNVILILMCEMIALGAWEQGLNLVGAIAIIFMIRVFKDRNNKFNKRVLGMTLTIIFVYLIIRIQGITQEILNPNEEAAFVLYYKSLFPMLDDLWLNFLGYTNSIVMQILPFFAFTFSSALDIPISTLNTYNQAYSNFPNAPYELSQLWMAGFSLAILVYLFTKWLKKDFVTKNYDLIVIFISGYIVSLPMMFRDYLFMDHYSIGYKVSISQIAFAFLIIETFSKLRMFKVLYIFGLIRIVLFAIS